VPKQKVCAKVKLAVIAGAIAISGALSGSALAAGGLPPRAYELVSPVDKNGGDVMAYSARTHASTDGDAIGYGALLGFGDVQGTGVAVEYLAQRTPNGWVTHAIDPRVRNDTLKGIIAGADVFYDGDFSPDFQRAVLFSARPVTGDAGVAGVANLYRRDDLRTPGPGTYQLLTACPLCAATSTSLEPLSGTPGISTWFMPALAGTSPDMEHVAFESIFNLTADAPPQPPECGTASIFFPPPAPVFCHPRLYEWDHGTVRLAGVLPDGSPADASFAGTGARKFEVTPHVVSDGSDGHSRIVFTQPTDASGQTADQLDPFSQLAILVFTSAGQGNVFMRVDHAQTVLLNASERSSPDAFAPAQYLDASSNGERVFFMTTQALTDDAPANGDMKLYMYDASKPASAPDNLTLVSRDDELADGAFIRGVVGVSRDGHYVYFVSTGQLVSGGPTDQTHLFLWHDGAITDVAPVSTGSALTELVAGGPSSYQNFLRQARVTPDGRNVVFTTLDGIGGYDQSACFTAVGPGCREVYVYSADTNQLACASCNPSGAPATGMASVAADEIHGGAHISGHENRGISDDGRYVFFSTTEALVPEDTNGKSDAYVYDVSTRRVALLSTGKSTSDSWFVDAGADGRDAFFVTRQQLVGWDRDGGYDLYDARVGGGLPEPPAPAAPCGPGACQGTPTPALAAGSLASDSYSGPGNAKARLRAHTRARHARARCRQRAKRRGARGKRRRCVKRTTRRTRGTRRAS